MIIYCNNYETLAKSFKFADVENNMQIGKVYVAQGFCLKYRLKEKGVNA